MSARWRLTQPHFLKLPHQDDLNLWQYTETNRETGRANRKTFKVDVYLDPEDPAYQNYDGMIVVSNGADRQYPKDYIFEGKPTPDMEPLNEEADAISAETSKDWKHPINSLDANGGFAGGLQKEFAELIEALKSNGAVAVPAQAAPGELDELKKMVQELANQNAELQGRMEALVRDKSESIDEPLDDTPTPPPFVAKPAQPSRRA